MKKNKLNSQLKKLKKRKKKEILRNQSSSEIQAFLNRVEELQQKRAAQNKELDEQFVKTQDDQTIQQWERVVNQIDFNRTDLHGYSVDQDYIKAMEYYQKAVDKGNIEALNKIGTISQKGYGVKKDYGKAIEYYQKAADQGNSNRLNLIGYLYEKGLG